MTTGANRQLLFNRLQAGRLYLALLVIVGAALRVAELWAPLTHDELSALGRLRFDTFADLLRFGVYPDGHPAGMQVLLWLWSHVAGSSTPLLRLPFLLMGIGCIPLMYSIGRRWYGERAALLATTLLAFSQYTVYYTMPLRPYGIGLFFILAALHFWTRLCVEHRTGLLYYAGFVLATAACAYTHYFCALTAALLAVAGLFHVGRRELWRYLVACLVSVLLFVPHLDITHHQLFDLKGVGAWLGRPTGAFFWHYLRYLTHHSYLVLLLLFAAVILCSHHRLWRQRRPLLFTAALLFLLPLAAGFVYSRAVSPVLQFSVLIFSYPFLLLTLTALADDDRRPLAGDLATALLGVSLLVTLFVTRQHYDVIHREYIEASARLCADADHRYGSDNVLNLANTQQPLLAQYGCRPTDIDRDTLTDAVLLDQWLSTAKADYVVAAKLPEPVMAVIQRHYPVLLDYRACTTTELCLFGREGKGMAWPGHVVKEGHTVAQGEYTTLLDTAASVLADSRFFLINTTATADRGGLMLVMETLVAGRKADYRSVPLDSVATLPLKEELCIKSRAALRHSRVKIYLWDPDGTHSGTAVDYRVSITPDNPYVYALLEEL